jgi:hypothetical protein
MNNNYQQQQQQQQQHHQQQQQQRQQQPARQSRYQSRQQIIEAAHPYYQQFHDVYSTFGFLRGIHHNAGWIFAATLAILSQRIPCGLVSCRPFCHAERVRRAEAAERVVMPNLDDRRTHLLRFLGDISVNDAETTIRTKTGAQRSVAPGAAKNLNRDRQICASALSAEAVDDIGCLLGMRFIGDRAPEAPLREASLGAAVTPYLKEAAERHDDGADDGRYTSLLPVFDPIRYNALEMPLQVETAIFVLEAMNPNLTPSPQLLWYHQPGTLHEGNVVLRLWRHSYLRIPLKLLPAESSPSQQRFGHAKGLLEWRLGGDDTIPLWLQELASTLKLYGNAAAAGWMRHYTGLHTPSYGQPIWSQDLLEHFSRQLYDGWLWVLAGLHWILVALYSNSDADTFASLRTWLQHYLAAIRITRGRLGAQDRVPFTFLDASTMPLGDEAQWATNVARESEQPLRIATPEELLADLYRLGVIAANPSQSFDVFSSLFPEEAKERERTTSAKNQFSAAAAAAAAATNSGSGVRDLYSRLRIALVAYRVLLGKLDAAIVKYIKERHD